MDLGDSQMQNITFELYIVTVNLLTFVHACVALGYKLVDHALTQVSY